MSTFRRRLMQSVADSEIPIGCTRLEYLESYYTDTNKGQYIDTGRPMKSTDVFGITILGRATTTDKSMFGWRWKGAFSDGYHCLINSLYQISFAYGTSTSNANRYNPYQLLNVIINPNKKIITINDSQLSGSWDWAKPYDASGSSVYNVCLFVANQIGNITSGSKSRIYDYWVQDKDGNMIQHLVPILDDKGEPCMYDIVNKEYFYNQRPEVGSFLYGLPEKETSSCLVNVGNAYIDTNVPLTNNISYEIKFRFTPPASVTQYYVMLGSGESTSNRLESLLNLWNDYIYSARFGTTKSVITDLTSPHVIVSNKKQYILDGTAYSWSPTLEANGGNIYIFRTSRTTLYPFLGKIYYCKLYDGEALIRDFIPHFQDGKWGMLDNVENKFYTSPNGELFDGYIPNE